MSDFLFLRSFCGSRIWEGGFICFGGFVFGGRVCFCWRGVEELGFVGFGWLLAVGGSFVAEVFDIDLVGRCRGSWWLICAKR